MDSYEKQYLIQEGFSVFAFSILLYAGHLSCTLHEDIRIPNKKTATAITRSFFIILRSVILNKNCGKDIALLRH
jgi:hypothetical protein